MEIKTPPNTVPCWYITENDKVEALVKSTEFSQFRPHCFFKLLERIDEVHIIGIIGHLGPDGPTKFHKFIDTTYTYFQDYKNRKKVYFTFDNIAIYQLVELITSPDGVLRFSLKRLNAPKAFKQNQAFMIMPFSDNELDSFYIENIKTFLYEELKIEIKRADDFSGNDIIVDTIYKQIEQAEFVIAETSKCNKNVFYELGYADAIGAEIITLQNESISKVLFFDRSHVRSIFYNPNQIEQFKQTLTNTIDAIRSKKMNL